MVVAAVVVMTMTMVAGECECGVGGGGIDVDAKGTLYPQTIKLSCNFTVLHTHELGWRDPAQGAQAAAANKKSSAWDKTRQL